MKGLLNEATRGVRGTAMSAAPTGVGVPIGSRQFTDGTTRPVFRDQADDRQNVLDDDGQRTFKTQKSPI